MNSISYYYKQPAKSTVALFKRSSIDEKIRTVVDFLMQVRHMASSKAERCKIWQESKVYIYTSALVLLGLATAGLFSRILRHHSNPLITSVSNQWGYDYSNDQIYRIKNGAKVIYKIGNFLGQGATATVFELVPNDPQKKIKAVKFSYEYLINGEFDKLLSLTSEGQPVGIQLRPKAKITFANKNMIILPKYDCSLDQIEDKQITLNANQIMEAARQLIEGLYFLYQKNYIVSDIGLSNTFYRVKKGVPRFDLSDLAFAKKETFTNEKNKQVCYGKMVNSLSDVLINMNVKNLSPEFKSLLTDMHKSCELEKIRAILMRI